MVSGSFAHKIRVWTVSLVIIFLSAVLLGWHELAQIRNRTNALAENTKPLIHLTRELSNAVANINAIALEISSSTSGPALDAAEARATALLSQTRRNLETFAGYEIVTIDDLEDFSALIELQAVVVNRSEYLREAKAAALAALLRVEQHLLGARVRLIGEAREANNAASSRHHNTNALDKLRVVSGMESLSAQLLLQTVMSNPEAEGSATGIASDLRAKADEFLAGLYEFSGGEVGEAIRRDMEEYVRRTFGPDGSYAVAKQSARDIAKRDAKLLEVTSNHDGLKARLEQEIVAVEAVFLGGARETAEVFRRFLTRDVLFIGAAVLLASFYFWLKVERNLVSRLTRIALRIRDIADGDVSLPVDITGSDEVGEVERAAEASRHMSISLQRVNEELERFAYVAAHDLRSPLRAVSDLLRWTHEDYGAALPKGARENLDMVEARVKRLSGHLSALLHYARAGQTDTARGLLDLPSFVADVRASHVSNDGYEVNLVGEPRVIETYPAPVSTILLNLIANAIKHHDRDTGKIIIHVSQLDNAIQFAVSDDGPGIMPEFHEKIFVLFQTLQSRDVVEGTGLGLALVQKLVLSLDGSIDVVSDPRKQRGTTITVTLPTAVARGAETTMGKAA